MIPRANITAWRKSAPWPDNTQVEQDLEPPTGTTSARKVLPAPVPTVA